MLPVSQRVNIHNQPCLPELMEEMFEEGKQGQIQHLGPEGGGDDHVHLLADGFEVHVMRSVEVFQPFPRSARAAGSREAVNRAVFGDNPPLSMKIWLLNRFESPRFDAI